MPNLHRASFLFLAATGAAVLAMGCGRYADSYTETRVVRTPTPTVAVSGNESPLIHPPPSRRPIQRVVAVNQPRTARGQREYRVVTAPAGEQASVNASEPQVITVPVAPVAPAPPPPAIDIEVDAAR